MAQTMQYKCPCCDGKIEFDSGIQQMKCPYCDTTFDVETLKSRDAALNEQAPEEELKLDAAVGGEWGADEAEQMVTFTCQSCGGELITDNTTAATSCPFCGNPVMLMSRMSGTLRPDYVIPFKLDKAAAKAGLMKHLEGKRLLPKVFKDQNHLDEIKGVYVPFWLFDADADADMRYRATQVRTWSDSKYIYTERKVYIATRVGKIGYQHVPVDGSEKMADDLMESIEPFDFSQAVDFQTAYLSGFLADRYDVTAEASVDRANARMRRSVEQSFAETVQGYSSVETESANVHLKNAQAKYALYPVWLLNTTWNGKQYTFAMNGQTGKFVGDLPMDKAAYWRWFGIIAGAVTAAGMLITKLLGWY
ncbi:MAG: hypothetical protein IJU16_01395 [Clostridia bacterium]|nr:hypothetical protein [Clostridia bacterium]